jgi:TP901 family phage tail tape measure protein
MADENIVTNITATSNFSDLIGDVNRVAASLAKLQQQLVTTDKAFTTQVSKINATFAGALSSSGQFSTHFVTLASDAEKFGKSLDSGKLKLRDYYSTLNTHAKTSGGLIRDLARQQTALQQAIVQPLGKNAEGMQRYNIHVARGLDDIANKTKIAGMEAGIMNKVIQQGAGQLINWGKNTQWAGRQLTVGLTLPIVAFGKAAADAFRQADAELIRLTKVYGDLAGTSASELRAVRKEVSDTAAELAKAYGAAYTETISLAADIAATGQTGEGLIASTRETTRLAILGEVDRQEAMKATLAIQTAFKQNTEELSESINFLNAVENQTSTSLGDLVEAIPKAGPVVKSLGGDIQDLALYLTAMREGGVNASEGANAIKSSLASLINPTKVAKDMFKGFGIDLEGIVTSNAGNVTATIIELQGALDKLDPLQKSKAIEQLFGKFQFARMGALFNNLGKQGSQTLQVMDLMKASSEELANVASRELAQVTESASGRYRRAVEGLKADLASVGETFLGIATGLVTFVDKIVNLINRLPDPVKKILAGFAGLTALAGPLIMLTGLLANFFGYIIKGVAHFRALFKGAEGWKLLTPEIVAANNAASLIEKSFYSDAKAALVLKDALAGLINEFTILQSKAQAGAISVAPALSTMAGNVVIPGGGLGREVNPQHPLLSAKDTRSMSHMNPVAGMSAEQRAAQTLFGVVPGAPRVNNKIKDNPQMYMEGDLPKIPGLTSVGGVSTGVVAGEAAKFHSMTGALAMQSQQEIALLRKEIASTGYITNELSGSYQALLPEITKITGGAAQQSAAIVSQLQAGKINLDQARAKIVALNAQIESMIAQTVSSVAQTQGRTANLSMIPLTGQPIVDPGTGKSNMKELFRPRNRGLFTRIAQGLGVKTFGAPYSTETTRPKRFAGGVVGVGAKLPKFANLSRAKAAAKLLREFSKQSGRIGGSRVPSKGQADRYLAAQRGERLTSKSRGMSTAAHVEEGAGKTFREFSKREGDLYKDPDIIKYGITPTKAGVKDDNQVLIHGAGKAFRERTKNLETLPGQSAPMIPGNQLSSMSLTGKTDKPYVQVLPTQFVKNREGFNKNLNKGKATSADWAPVTGDDMVSLKYFLKEQGVDVHSANRIANNAAEVLNAKIASHKGPITENIFGDMLNQASVRGLRSAFHPMMRQKAASANSNDPFWGRGNLEPTPFKDGVTKLPGFGGGDIIPALLEPGESVVTKTATAGNEGAIAFMNAGGKIEGFQEGVVAVGEEKPNRVRQGLSRIGGGSGMVTNVGGSIAGSMIGQKYAGDMGSLVGMFAGPMLLNRIGAVGKALMSLRGAGLGARGAMMLLSKAALANPYTALALAVTAAGVAIFKMWDNARKARLASQEALKVNSKEAKELGISYTNLGDTLTNALTKARKERDLLLAKSATASQVGGGLFMTVKELDALQKKAKETQGSVVEMFNNMNSNDVIAAATALKVQLVAAGKSAADAAKEIFSIISVSNKASQAVKAISSKSFMDVIDKASAAKQSISTFDRAVAVGADKKELAAAFESSMDSISSYYKSLIGTKDETGKVIDQTKALALTMEKINELGGERNKISKETFDTLVKENPELRSIIKETDTLGDSWAKIQLYTKGITQNLSNLSGDAAKNLLNVMTAMESASQDMVTNVNLANNSLQQLAIAGATLKSQADSDRIASEKAAKAAKRNGDEEIKAIDKKIKKIQEAADARRKALEDEADQESFLVQIQKEKIKYADALASGNMSEAAQAQLNIRQLTIEDQKKRAMAAIDAKEKEEVNALEQKKLKIQESIAAAQKRAAAAAEKAAISAEKYSKIQILQNSIANTITQAGRYEKGSKEFEALSNALKSDVAALAQLGPEGAKAAKSMTPAYTAQSGIAPGAGPKQDWVGQLGKLTTENNKLAEGYFKKFGGDVENFGKYVALLKDLPIGEIPKGRYGDVDATRRERALARATFGKKGIYEWDAAKNAEKLIKGENLKPGDKFFYESNEFEVAADGKSLKKLAMGGQIKHYEPGGRVSGPGTGTSDSIPAMLSNGEYVIRASAVQAIGTPMLDSINKMAMGGLATTYNIPTKSLAVNSPMGYNRGGSVHHYEVGGLVINTQPGQSEMEIARLAVGMMNAQNALGAKKVGEGRLIR